MFKFLAKKAKDNAKKEIKRRVKKKVAKSVKKKCPESVIGLFNTDTSKAKAKSHKQEIVKAQILSDDHKATLLTFLKDDKYWRPKTHSSFFSSFPAGIQEMRKCFLQQDQEVSFEDLKKIAEKRLEKEKNGFCCGMFGRLGKRDSKTEIFYGKIAHAESLDMAIQYINRENITLHPNQVELPKKQGRKSPAGVRKLTRFLRARR